MHKFFIYMILQGFAMAATLFNIPLKGVDIPVIFEHREKLPLVSMQLVFKSSGSMADKTPGTAYLAAELLNEGSQKSGSIPFATFLDNHAISMHASAGKETLVINMESLKSEFGHAVEKLRELLKEPNYDNGIFQKIQNETVGYLMQKKGDFDYIASNQLKNLIFEGTVLQYPSRGTLETVKEIKLGDIKNFLQEHLYLDNMIVVIGGDLSEDEAKKAIAKALDPLKRGDVKPLGHIETSGGRKEKISYEDTQQAYIYFGAPYRMRSDDQNRTYGKVAAFILGSSGFGSRLMEEVRVKRGLAYSAYARLSVHRTHSYFSGYLQTKIGNMKDAMNLVASIVKEFADKGATAKELESAKKFFLGSEPLRMETLSQRIGRAFFEYYDGLGLGYGKKELEIIRNMRLEDLNSFIKSHPEIADISWSVVTKKIDR